MLLAKNPDYDIEEGHLIVIDRFDGELYQVMSLGRTPHVGTALGSCSSELEPELLRGSAAIPDLQLKE